MRMYQKLRANSTPVRLSARAQVSGGGSGSATQETPPGASRRPGRNTKATSSGSNRRTSAKLITTFDTAMCSGNRLKVMATTTMFSVGELSSVARLVSMGAPP